MSFRWTDLIPGASEIRDGLSGIRHGLSSIHKLKHCFSVDEDCEGVVINAASYLIEWNNIVAVVKHELEPVDDNGMASYELILRGGLVVVGLSEGGELDEYLEFPQAERLDLTEFNDDDMSPENLKQLMQAMTDLEYSVTMADKLRDIQGVYIGEEQLLWVSGFTALKALACYETLDDMSGRGVKHWKAKMLDAYAQARQKVCDQILNVDKPTDDEESLRVGLALYCIGIETADKHIEDVKRQKAMYTACYAARQYAREVVDDEFVDSVLSASAGGAEPFGAAEWKNERKMIICPVESEKRRPNFKAVAQEKSVHNVMIMSAEDVERYNDSETGQDYPLLFAKGHPIAGNAYVQNPFRQNEYFEASSYKNNILISKYEELCRLLECLGATEISMSVEESKSQNKSGRTKRKVGVRGGYSGVEGSVNYESEEFECAANDAYQKMSKTRVLHPVGRPHVPDDLIFYPNEPSWRRLAQSVLEGRVIKESADVEFKENSVFSAKQCQAISADVKSLIPGYDISVGGDYASESEIERKKCKSEVWHYDVTFASVARAEEVPEKKGTVAVSRRKAKRAGCRSEGEELVMKYATRYAHTKAAQENGLMTNSQRTDLERLAKKYKVSDKRLDEIIDEAFA